MTFQTATSWHILLELQAYMLGYGAPTNAKKVRDKLQDIGQYEPGDAQYLERELMLIAFQAIALGNGDPQQIARDALAVAEAKFPRGWVG